MNLTHHRRLAMALAALLGLLVIAGCSSQSGGEPSSAGAADSAGQDGLKVTAGRESSEDSTALNFAQTTGAAPELPPEAERQVISRGAVTLQSDDIATARADAIDIVRQAGGHIDTEESLSGDDGTMTRSSLVFRVPSQNFDAVMDQLAGVADAVRQARQAEDVTTKVIDVAARIRVQESSIRRLEALYARATTIGQIITLESQLSRRQADLDSLKQRQAWLRNQTSLATIDVRIVEPSEEEATEPAKEHRGFLKGLYAGWDAFTATTMGILAAVGAVLPFVGALIVLGLAYRVYRWARA